MNLFTDMHTATGTPVPKTEAIFTAKTFYIERCNASDAYVLMTRRGQSLLYWRAMTIPERIVNFATENLKVLRTFKGYVARVPDVKSIPDGVRWTRAKGDFWIETDHPSPPRFDAFDNVHTFSTIDTCDKFILSTLAPKVGEYAKRGRMISFKVSAVLKDAIRFSNRIELASYAVLNSPVDPSTVRSNVDDQLAAITDEMGVENHFVVSIDAQNPDNTFNLGIDWTTNETGDAQRIINKYTFVADSALGMRLRNRFDAIEDHRYTPATSFSVLETVYLVGKAREKRGISYMPRIISRWPPLGGSTPSSYHYATIKIQVTWDNSNHKQDIVDTWLNTWAVSIDITERTEAEMFLNGEHPIFNSFECAETNLPHVVKLNTLSHKELYTMMGIFLHSRNSPVTGKWSISHNDNIYLHFEKAEDATLFKVSLL